MKRTVFTDPFFYKQPELSFIDELKKPLHEVKPDYYGKRDIEQNEIDAHGIYIAEKYPDDPDDLLDTVYNDFNLFTKVYGISGKRFPVYLKKGQTECFEAYVIEISSNSVTVTANDTEGVRRAVIWLEDELRRREGAYLEETILKKKPYIKSRITRCFFSPINRAPKFGDELSDDIDYYPEEYLNRLMHEGANGVWIYTRFSDILPSDIITEYGKGYEKRVEKLNRTIKKCRRYGIGVYVFAIEPVAFTPEMAEKYSDMAGAKAWNDHSNFCCSSERGKAYCYEAGKKLVELCPDLRGLISITYGERATSCATNIRGALDSYIPAEGCGCARCAGKKNGEILALALECLKSGSRQVKPEFEVVSWTYGQRLWSMDDVIDYVDCAPDDVVLMQNFEDIGYEEQLGVMRQAEDYWLSYIGPSELFEKTAIRANQLSKQMFAKMQVCCSHEIATVPYVPVPGILYKKYAAARKHNVSGVMQCWYFGNYPSIMSKAAGELAFEGEFKNEDEFLEKLAGIYFGKTKAKTVSAAWKLFEKGYRNYPLNVLFSYYGPMHDSIVWKLSLKPKNFMPARTWQLVDPVDGDRICDSLMSGHTLEEAIELCNIMRENWNKGIKLLETIECQHSEEMQAIDVAKAIGILFDSGTNILEFYLKRDKLGKGSENAERLLSEMHRIVELEKKNSLEMIPLCKLCKSLGYHSESEGFKFFPEKIEDRINQLDTMLKTEFYEVESRIAEGKTALEYYDGVEDCPHLKRYLMKNDDIKNAEWETFGENGQHSFKMSWNEGKIYIELKSKTESPFIICPEYNLTRANVPIMILKDGSSTFDSDAYLYWQMFKENAKQEKAKYRNVKVFDDEAYHVLITLDIKEIGLDKIRPMKMKFVKDGESWCLEPERELLCDTMPRATLGKACITPEDFGWVIPV